MQYKMADGRLMLASPWEVRRFFARHRVEGGTITNILPGELDYGVHNMGDMDWKPGMAVESAIDTEGSVFFCLDGSRWLEVCLNGDAPLVLGHSTRPPEDCPVPDGEIYRLSTLFKKCIGRKIVRVELRTSNEKMTFPVFCGIDFSKRSIHVTQIDLKLDDGSTLSMGGLMDCFQVEHLRADGTPGSVPIESLAVELSDECKAKNGLSQLTCTSE